MTEVNPRQHTTPHRHEADYAHDVLPTRMPDFLAAEDRMQMLDLIPVLFGRGVSVANSTIREPHIEPDLANVGKSFLMSPTYHRADILTCVLQGETVRLPFVPLAQESQPTSFTSSSLLLRLNP